MRLVLAKWWSLEKDHGDDCVDHKMIKGSTWKEEREKQKQVDQGKCINRFLFCTQDTIEGISDLKLIAVLLRGEFHGWNGYQVPLGDIIHALHLGT
jgi:hypothetical protein